jgi:hypothetical protein
MSVPRCDCRFNVASDITNEGLATLRQTGHGDDVNFGPRRVLPSFGMIVYWVTPVSIFWHLIPLLQDCSFVINFLVSRAGAADRILSTTYLSVSYLLWVCNIFAGMRLKNDNDFLHNFWFWDLDVNSALVAEIYEPFSLQRFEPRLTRLCPFLAKFAIIVHLQHFCACCKCHLNILITNRHLDVMVHAFPTRWCCLLHHVPYVSVSMILAF